MAYYDAVLRKEAPIGGYKNLRLIFGLFFRTVIGQKYNGAYEEN